VDHVSAGGRVVAHNAGFERAILDHVLDWPKIELAQWWDTSAMAARAALPRSLASLGEALGCQVQKDDEGHNLMLILCKADNPEPTPEQLERLLQYCEIDVLSMLEIIWRMPKPTVRERMVELFDVAVNRRGFAVDTELVQAMSSLVKARKGQLAEIVWEATGDMFKAPSVPPLIRWLNDNNVPLATVSKKMKDGVTRVRTKLDRAAVVALLEREDLPGPARTLLEARLEASKLTSLSKLQSVTDRLSVDGRLRGSLLYCGAHTGRWASTGLQVHNLPKCKLKDKLDPFRAAVMTRSLAQATAVVPDVLSGMSQSLRSMIVAAPGYDLFGADYNAIEARVLAWLAGEQSVLDIFASGRDIYMEDARRIGSEDRDMGKVQRLGLGYGMGAVQFVTVSGIAPKEAKRIVKLWREGNPAIVQLWHDLEAAVKDAIRAPGAEILVGSWLTVRSTSTCVTIELPSGRRLNYWRPSLRTTTRTLKVVDDSGNIVPKEVELQEIRFFSGTWDGMEVDSTYGGKLTENVTQAVARDVLADAGVALEQYDYPVVVHVHDSLIAEVPAGQGDPELFSSILTRPSAWTASLPLAVKPYRSKYFHG
jgi:DNA polymerase